jgi:hypothetical protein
VKFPLFNKNSINKFILYIMKKSRNILRFLLGMIGFLFLSFCAYSFVTTGVFDVVSGLTGGAISIANFNPALLSTDDLLRVPGTENMGGFSAVVYFAPDSFITTHPTLQTSPDAIADLARLDGNFVMVNGKTFIKFDCVPNRVGVKPESQGEFPGARSFKDKGSFYIVGNEVTIAGWARYFNNITGTIIYNEISGNRRVFGNASLPVQFKATIEKGEKPADPVGLMVEWECDAFVSGPFYYGTIVLSSETLPAISS